ncbi:dihydrolipoyl dehydrogenase family protein [Elioraea sp.]|uniref:dihydrolipoyl dehydrogenase family protein n=1 Tax=Elioraea sp. TaxID=2185103 RepID=UPI003F7264DE
MPERREFDLVVIGAGAAGLSVTAVAAQLGVPVALIERNHMGGDCLNFGCVPSKALLAAAHHAAAIRAAPRYGVTAGQPQIEFSRVLDHVHHAIAEIAPNDSEERFTGLGATVIRGEARFTGRDMVAVNGMTLKARRVVVAAGARAAVPPIPGLDTVPHFTNETLWENRVRPGHLFVIGGGPIGLEMAFAHRRLGSEVTVLEVARMLGRDDAELAEGALLALKDEGIVLRDGVKIARVEGGEGAIVVVLDAGEGREERIEGSHLLVAAGRRPNLDTLDLGQAGIETTKLGVKVDRGLRSVSNRKVYAIGDIADIDGIGPRQFTHVGSYHAGIVIRSALFRLPAKVDYAALPRVTYIEPELAQVGMTEEEARAAGHRDLVILRWPLAENDRAITEGSTRGLVKVVATPKGKILGAGILAPHAGEMIGMWGLAITTGTKLSTVAGMIAPYPTLSEASKRAAGQAFVPKLFAPMTKRIVSLLRRLG